MPDNLTDRVIDGLIETVRKEEEGKDFGNPDREFIFRYYLTHQDSPEITAMMREYFNTFS